MPRLSSLPYPNAVNLLMDMLEDIAPSVMALPTDFSPPMIQVRRVGGQPDPHDITDFPLLQVSCYGATFPQAQSLADQVQVRILSSPLTEVGGVLIDSAAIYVGEQEVPDVNPDDRRITNTYELGLRRQFRPTA